MTIRDRAPDPHAHLPSRSKLVSRRSNPKPVRRTSKRISLALQGGGSLGAFTWGVLDRLLEEDDLTFDAISGASAGAMNAVVVAAGLLAGGKPEARRRLDHFWERLSQIAPPKSGATASLVADMTSRFLTPYQLNPLNLNPDHLSVEDLEARLRSAQDPTATRHVQVIWLFARGHTIADVAAVTSFVPRWIEQLLARYNAHGPEARGDLRRRTGSAPSVLRPELLARVPERLAPPPSDGGLWSSRKVAAWMAGELGLAAVLPQRGWEALKAIGWSVQKPRPRHPASATPEEREAFKKAGAGRR